jgi:hypothetical protein
VGRRNWTFFGSDNGGHTAAVLTSLSRTDTNFADASWRNVDLLHDWSIEGPFSEQPGSASFAHLPTGIGSYRKLRF